MSRPLLLIDVDGVISLFGFDPERRPEGRFEVVDGIAHFLSATAGDHLRRLCEVFEPAWCTGWEEKANEYLPGALGLSGPFPHLGFADATPTVAGHWKLAAIDAYAGPDAAAHDGSRHRSDRRARRAPARLGGADRPSGPRPSRRAEAAQRRSTRWPPRRLSRTAHPTSRRSTAGGSPLRPRG